MDRLYKLRSIRNEPIISLCWIIALNAIIGGLYIISPFIVLTGAGLTGGAAALYSTAASVVGIWTLGILAVISGILIIYGIKKNANKWIARGLLLNLILRIYTFLISALVYGFQSTWFSSLALLLIVLILYLVVRNRR